MCWINEADPWRVYHWEMRTARKEHQCFECERTICRGERYHYAVGLPDERPVRWDVFKLCPHCDAASKWLTVVCRGFLYGGIAMELREHWDEEYLLRSIGLARLVLGIERRWQRTKYATGLMEIPTWAGDVAKKTMEPVWTAERIERERIRAERERREQEWRERRSAS